MDEKIIDPVDPALLERELTPERRLRRTNKADNEIYVITAHNAPNVMREIGRLREIAFRAAGGGTGKSLDIDEYDLMTPACSQLIVWDKQTREILGGYRFITGNNIRFREDGMPRIATSHMFRFSERFIKEFLPYTLELGRSFVRVEYQSSKAGAKALYVLDNLWDGLGALTVIHPELKYLFGKVTMYPSYSHDCRNMILYFLNKHFPDPDHLIEPISPLEIDYDLELMREYFVDDDFAADYRTLHREVRNFGVNIPPLVNAYMSLSPTMRMFGTAINDEFGDVEETGIFLVIDEILDEKKRRHIGTFDRDSCLLT